MRAIRASLAGEMKTGNDAVKVHEQNRENLDEEFATQCSTLDGSESRNNIDSMWWRRWQFQNASASSHLHPHREHCKSNHRRWDDCISGRQQWCGQWHCQLHTHL
jgi:hypothetical protein